MSRAMEDSGVKPSDIDYINAHATSTKQGDMFEAIALDKLFRGEHAYISSTKSMTGHECWMAGASEVIYSILMMKNGFMAGNLNFETPDEETAVINVLPERKEQHFDLFLSNSFGFGGTNSTLIIKNL